MSAVSMCTNTECPLRSTCYRYRMKPDKLQAYFCFTPNDEKGCDFRWDNTNIPSNRMIPTEEVDDFLKPPSKEELYSQRPKPQVSLEDYTR